MPAHFDTKAFLAKVGSGKTVSQHAKGATLFRQGDAADTVLYLQSGRIKISITQRGKDAVVGILEAGQFLGEQCLTGNAVRVATAVTLSPCVVTTISKAAMTSTLETEPSFSQLFVLELLRKNGRIEADLTDQLFNSSEKRLARTLLLLAHFGTEGEPQDIVGDVTQETLAEMIGTTRTRVSHFMNKFRKNGFIDYDGKIKINPSLLISVLQEKPQIADDGGDRKPRRRR